MRPIEHIQESKIIRNTFYLQFLSYIISELAHMVGAVVDGVIIGRCLGLDSMAAFGIISPLMAVFSLFGVILSTGSRNRFTRLIGEGKMNRAQGVFSLSLLLSVGFATITMIFLLLFSNPISSMLGASKNAAALLPKARAYLIGIAIGLPAINAMRVLNLYLPIDNDRNLPIIASFVLTGADILFDLLVVFFHGDTLGMGLATSISYYCAFAVLLFHFRKKESILRLTWKKLPWAEIPSIVAQGIPIGVCRLSFTIRSAFMNRLLSIAASTSAIGAYTVYQQADDILGSLTIGMADTVATIAGVLAGEEDRPRMKRLLLTSLQATMMITLGVSVIFWFVAPQFSTLYVKSSEEALAYSIRAVRSYAIGMMPYGLNMIYLNYLQGIGRNRLSSISGFLSECGFLILSAWILSHWYGPDAVWIAFPVTQLLMFILYWFVVTINSVKMDLKNSVIWDKVLMLPLSFDVPDEDRIDVSINSMHEVNQLSDTIWNFCEAHGCDEKKQYYMSLAVEEFAGNTIQHGFSADPNHKHSIDVRLVKKKDVYILRIRDDCLIFDPVKQLKLFSEEDESYHIGLRMIFHLADEVKYTCILKLNNLLIRA